MRPKEGNKENQILESARVIFARDGFYNSTIAKISKMSGVSTGSIYNYFTSKTEIFYRILNDFWGNLNNQFNEIKNTHSFTPDILLEKMIDIVVDNMETHKDISSMIVNNYQYFITEFEQNNGNNFINFLEQGKQLINVGAKQNYFNFDYDTELLRTFLFGAITNIMLHRLNSPEIFSCYELKKNIRFYFLNGIKINHL